MVIGSINYNVYQLALSLLHNSLLVYQTYSVNSSTYFECIQHPSSGDKREYAQRHFIRGDSITTVVSAFFFGKGVLWKAPTVFILFFIVKPILKPLLHIP